MGKRLKKIKLPGIGMRIVKSAVAIAVCYLVNRLRGDQGIVFYSQLSALWCIQMYRSNTRQNAVQRIIGTFVGAIYGLIYLLICPLFINKFSVGKFSIGEILGELIISVLIGAVLYTTVVLNKKQASYFSCVVFLSIVINHATDSNPFMFVFNRFLDTLIGILVGILINNIRLCFHPNRSTLFISGLDGTLLNQKDMLSPFSKVELNRMIDDGMKFTISTMRTPAAILEPMKDVRLNIPVIAMNGAVLYDTVNYQYKKVYVISIETSQRIMELIKEAEICWYANVIIEDMLVIYYEDTEDEINKGLLENLRTSPYRNYVKRPLPADEDVTYFMLLDKEDKISNFYNKLMDLGFGEKLRIITYKSNDFRGYAYIKIYNKNATKENMIEYLKKEMNAKEVVTFGTIKDQYDVYIETSDANKVVREVRKRYEPILK